MTNYEQLPATTTSSTATTSTVGWPEKMRKMKGEGSFFLSPKRLILESENRFFLRKIEDDSGLLGE